MFPGLRAKLMECRTSYGKNTVFPRLLNDATVYSIFDGGNIGLRRRQLQRLMQAEDYKPWASLW